MDVSRLNQREESRNHHESLFESLAIQTVDPRNIRSLYPHRPQEDELEESDIAPLGAYHTSQLASTWTGFRERASLPTLKRAARTRPESKSSPFTAFVMALARENRRMRKHMQLVTNVPLATHESSCLSASRAVMSTKDTKSAALTPRGEPPGKRSIPIIRIGTVTTRKSLLSSNGSLANLHHIPEPSSGSRSGNVRRLGRNHGLGQSRGTPREETAGMERFREWAQGGGSTVGCIAGKERMRIRTRARDIRKVYITIPAPTIGHCEG